MATGINDRVDRLEAIAEQTAERLFALERDVAIIKANYATKSDLAELKAELKVEIKVAIAEAKTSIIMWVVSAIFLAQLLPALLKNFGLYAH